jgi:hypothetical protein
MPNENQRFFREFKIAILKIHGDINTISAEVKVAIYTHESQILPSLRINRRIKPKNS